MTKLYKTKTALRRILSAAKQNLFGIPVFMVLTLFSISVTGLSQVSGDYKSIANGNWDAIATWQVYNGSVWNAATEKPGSASNVYIQAANLVTLTTNEACKDIHFASATSPNYGRVATVTYTLEVNGKIRTYSGILPGANVSSPVNPPFTKTSGGSGMVKIVGNSRTVTTTGEFGSFSATAPTTTGSIEIAMNPGQTATFQTAGKFASWNITSGTLDLTGRMSVDLGAATLGNVIVSSGATLISNSTGTVISRTGSGVGGVFTVNGTWILKGALPTIGMTTINLNGTVQYDASGPQTMLTTITGGASPNTYTNLILSNSGTKTLGSNTTANGTLSLSGSAVLALSTFSLTYGAASTLKYNGSIAQNTATAELPVTGGPNTLEIDNVSGVTHTGSATVNNLSITSGTFTLASGSSLITNGTVSGNVTYERAISGGAWHLISSPVSGAVSGMFLGSYLQKHSESTNSYTDVTTSAVPLSPMKGFALFDATGYIAQFTGPLNTGAMSYTTTYSGAGLGWNLAGNPYPSAIDFTKVTRNNVNNAFYVHISNSSWGVYAAGATSPDVVVTEFIAPGQGFFVEASANGSLSMDNTARVHNSIPFHKSGNVIPNIVRLQVTGNGYSDEALVRFLPEATPGFDGEYDAHKFYGDVAEAAQIYTVGGIPLAINALPETTTVPVGLHAGASGTYTIAANEINDFTEVSLEDTKTGVFTDLLKNSYTFNFAPGETEQRFVLHFGPLSVDETESSLANIYSYLKTINVNLKDQLVGDVFVYTITGQLVATKTSVSGSTGITIPNTGNYIVKVITRDSTLVRKVFIQ